MVIITLDQNDSTFNWSPRTWWCDSSSCWTIFSKYLYSYIVLKGNGPQYVDRGRSPYSGGILKCRINSIIFLDMTIRRWEFSRPYYWMWSGMWELNMNVNKFQIPVWFQANTHFFSFNMATASVLELAGGLQGYYTHICLYICRNGRGDFFNFLESN